MSDLVRFTAVTPSLIVRDIAASTTFYCEVLGFAVTLAERVAVP